MKIVGWNGSPQAEQSNTHVMVDAFLAGAWDAYLKTGDTENARACSHAIQSLHEDTEVQPEKRGDMGQSPSFIRFFISTLVHLFISPKKTMKSLAPTKVITAVWYYLTLCGVVLLDGYMIFALFLSTKDPELMILYLFPYTLLFLLIGAQCLSLGILILTTRLCGGMRGISETVKAALYGFTPSLLSFLALYSLVLFSGSFTASYDVFLFITIIVIFAAWSGYLIVRGLAEFHSIPLHKAWYSVILFFILILVIDALVSFTRT